MSRTHVFITIMAIGFAPAVGGAQTLSENDADAKEIASYRLTMDGVQRVASIMRAAAAAQKNDPTFQELVKTETELEAPRKKDGQTDAQAERIEALSARRQELKEKFDEASSMGDAKSLDEMAAPRQKEPQLVAALASTGMSAREFSKFTFAMLGASLAAGLQKQGMLTELPKEVSAENVKFILEHEAELQKLQEEMQGLQK